MLGSRFYFTNTSLALGIRTLAGRGKADMEVVLILHKAGEEWV